MITLIILHFIADFLFQSREMGRQKSSHWGYLTLHLMIQYLVFLPALGFTWSLVNALVHGLIDKNIWNAYKLYAGYKIKQQMKEEGFGIKPQPFYQSKEKFDKVFQINAQYYKYWEDHWFFVTIGFDQMLHMITLAVIWGMM